MEEKEFGAALVLHLAAAEPSDLTQWGDQGGVLAEELSALSVREASALGNYWRHFCTLKVRSNKVLNCLAHVRAKARTDDSLEVLLELGAPYAMLARIGHISWREYRRRVNPATFGGAGRPRSPTADEKARLDRALAEIQRHRRSGDGELGLSEWLALSRMTADIPLKVAWSYLSGGNE